jgi:hypothetical protein
MPVNAQDVEGLVLEKGCPESLIVSDADFRDIYQAYRQAQRDGEGVYIAVLNTKIRPSRKAKDSVVDLSKDNAFKEA